MIRETIVSSADAAGNPNFAPMGVVVEEADIGRGAEIGLRVYRGSRTGANLLEVRQGVVNLVDDVLLYVTTALFDALPEWEPSFAVRPPGMRGAPGRWEFVVVAAEEEVRRGARVDRVTGRVVHTVGGHGGFKGFCRAQWAVLEATIAATRVGYVGPEVLACWDYWQRLVERTGGPREKTAFRLVRDYLEARGLRPPVPPAGRAGS
ncbi:MAG: DUF447 family protein [Clostridia bacterium]|nr:DUF447 family protein [Clostridia bacterium]MDH7572295.1 DUF447 family protein [Clostridia bacterium]